MTAGVPPGVGWRIVLLSSGGVLALLGLVVATLGVGEPAARTAVRLTGATSLVLFLLVYTASSLDRLWPSDVTRRVRALRRWLGISFGLAHLMHGGVLTWLATHTSRSFEALGVPLMSLLSLGYVCVVAMLLTSSDAAQHRLGPRRWRALHSFGLHYVWLLFFVAYARALGTSLAYLGPFLAVLAALALRWRARPARRRASAA